MHSRFFAIIAMSIALGLLISGAFENWFWGYSFVWLLLLIGVFVVSISAVSTGLLRHLN
jgi:hypothetical protein